MCAYIVLKFDNKYSLRTAQRKNTGTMPYHFCQPHVYSINNVLFRFTYSLSPKPTVH